SGANAGQRVAFRSKDQVRSGGLALLRKDRPLHLRSFCPFGSPLCSSAEDQWKEVIAFGSFLCFLAAFRGRIWAALARFLEPDDPNDQTSELDFATIRGRL
ncbi:unnamed protein product, partial [Nesidiocoris tenuis]